ncbi:MAG: hypothetical protein JWP17_3539 [Solirubrobacterales bacterium]|nr:hypothetical protein [Solirubrobacterales bacterium]
MLTPRNVSGWRVANCRASAPWPSARMFTANVPVASHVGSRRLRQTSSIGGSSDSDDTALAVTPKRSWP